MSGERLFPRRLLVAWAVAAAFVFSCSLFVLMGRDDDGSSRPDEAGPSAYSRSAIGHAGLLRLLRKLDIRATPSQADSPLKANQGGVVVIAEPRADAAGLARTRALLGTVDLLLVLPKRAGHAAARRGRAGWARSRCGLDRRCGPASRPRGAQGRWSTRPLYGASRSRTGAAEPVDARAAFAARPCRAARSSSSRAGRPPADRLGAEGILVGEVRGLGGRRVWRAVRSGRDRQSWRSALARQRRASPSSSHRPAAAALAGNVVFDEDGARLRPSAPMRARLRLLLRVPLSALADGSRASLAVLGLLGWAAAGAVRRAGAAAAPALGARQRHALMETSAHGCSNSPGASAG
jgi:hypothetical protein